MDITIPLASRPEPLAAPLVVKGRDTAQACRRGHRRPDSARCGGVAVVPGVRAARRAAERAIRSADGIDSLEAVRIGGLDQWIHVRGEHTKNPVLLFLHGGPGAALIGVAGPFQTPWEKHFTIVQWDQRGAGKTYARNDRELQRRTMTVRQMQQDTLDMANYLRRRFEREKIVVLGASWGGVPGLWLAHEHPDVVAAYVGVGQAVDLGLNTKTA